MTASAFIKDDTDAESDNYMPLLLLVRNQAHPTPFLCEGQFTMNGHLPLCPTRNRLKSDAPTKLDNTAKSRIFSLSHLSSSGCETRRIQAPPPQTPEFQASPQSSRPELCCVRWCEDSSPRGPLTPADFAPDPRKGSAQRGRS